MLQGLGEEQQDECEPHRAGRAADQAVLVAPRAEDHQDNPRRPRAARPRAPGARAPGPRVRPQDRRHLRPRGGGGHPLHEAGGSVLQTNKLAFVQMLVDLCYYWNRVKSPIFIVFSKRIFSFPFLLNAHNLPPHVICKY